MSNPENREKISKARRGQEVSEETRQKISNSSKGRIFSEEHRKNLSIARKQRSPESEKKNREAIQNGIWKKRDVSLHRGTKKSGFRWVVNCRGGEHKLWSRIVYQNYYLNGKEIPKGYVVHHKDENPENDVPENLELWEKKEHSRFHSIGKKRGPMSSKQKKKISQSRREYWRKKKEGEEGWLGL